MWFGGFWIILYVALGILWLYAWAEIYRKAGHSRWLCLLMIVPAVNVITFLWLAFHAWPATGGPRE
mgnify:CR=1 FL=1